MATAIDDILKKYTDPETGSIHGAAFVAVDATGKIIYRGASGTRTLDPTSGQAYTPDTLTWIASQTKLATSVSVLQLVEKGLVGLDDDVREILPQLKDLKVLVGFEGDEGKPKEEVLDVAALGRAGSQAQSGEGKQGGGDDVKAVEKPIYEDIKGTLTLRHLLTHTSGFAYDAGNALLTRWSTAVGRTDNLFSGTIAGVTHPLVFQPGTSWTYGGGIDWAGQVVEKIAGQDLNTYQQENIWGPLGAKSTSFFPVKAFGRQKAENERIETTVRGEDGKLAKGVLPWKLEPGDALGGGGLYGTADDYILLLSALLRDGAGLLKKKETVDLLFSNHIGTDSIAALRKFVVGPTPDLSLSRLYVDSDEKWRDLGEVGHSLAGVLAPDNVSGRRKKGTLNWAGLPSLIWWIDRESGVAATFFTQIMPPELPATVLARELEAAVYSLVRGEK